MRNTPSRKATSPALLQYIAVHATDSHVSSGATNQPFPRYTRLIKVRARVEAVISRATRHQAAETLWASPWLIWSVQHLGSPLKPQVHQGHRGAASGP